MLKKKKETTFFFLFKWREDLGIHSPVIPTAATERILETLIWDGVMQHVETARPGKERQTDSHHVCQTRFKFFQYFPQPRGKSEVTGMIYPDGSDPTKRLIYRISRAQYRKRVVAKGFKIIRRTRSRASAKQHGSGWLEGQEQGSTPKIQHHPHFCSTSI